MAELLPCPFCGSTNIYCIDAGHKAEAWFIKCADCRAEFSFFDSEEEVVNAWNTRSQKEVNKLKGNEITTFEEVVKLVCVALGKQIPKKLVKKNPICYYRDTDGEERYAYDYHCPICDTKLKANEHHCPCGQALDWNDDETDKQMTDEQIIDAMEYCGSSGLDECEGCPFNEKCDSGEHLAKYAINIIKRQKAEIERLKKYEQ